MDALFRPPGSPLLLDPRDERVSDVISDGGSLAIVGVPWDWATAGRPGARFAPGEIRSRLLPLRTHAPSAGCSINNRITDLGDIAVVPGDFESTRKIIHDAASIAFEKFDFTVFLGGDHSVTRPIVEALAEEGKVGLLVLDAHYDLRSAEAGVTSGSWLRELLDEAGDRVRAAVIGVADFMNPAYLSEVASARGVLVITAGEALEGGWMRALELLETYNADYYYVSVDMDHLSQAYAPGVNAPTPLGLDPWTSARILVAALEKLKPRGMDIVEVVPSYDVNGSTIGLAAYFAALALCKAGAGQS